MTTPTVASPPALNRESMLSMLRGLKGAYGESFGIPEMEVFGSFARGEATETSDLDPYVRTRTANPYLLVHLKAIIEDRVHRKVDIVPLREAMNPTLQARIEREGIDI